LLTPIKPKNLDVFNIFADVKIID